MGGDVPGAVVLFNHSGPEVNNEILVVYFKGKRVPQFIPLQFLGQLLLLPVLPQLDLPQVLVFELLLVRVVEFLLDLIGVNGLLRILFTPIVVFDHHDSLAFVVPGCLGVLVDDGVFGADEEGLGEDSVDHHYVALDCEEAGVVGLGEVEQAVELLYAFLKLVLQLVDVLLLLLELLVVHVLLQLDPLELLIHLSFLLDLLLGLFGLKSSRHLNLFILIGVRLDDFFFGCVKLLE
jgi:hypothetical protein